MLGAGAVVVVAEGTDLLAAAANVLRFFRNESCGKCVPCRVGSHKAQMLLDRRARARRRPRGRRRRPRRAGGGDAADLDLRARPGGAGAGDERAAHADRGSGGRAGRRGGRRRARTTPDAGSTSLPSLAWPNGWHRPRRRALVAHGHARRPRSSGTARRCCGGWPGSSRAASTGRSWWCARPARNCRRCPTASRWSRTPARGVGRCRASPPASRAAASARDVAFVSSTDVPLLHPPFVRRVVGALDDEADVVLPAASAATRSRSPPPTGPRCWTPSSELIAADRMRPAFLFERVPRASAWTTPRCSATRPLAALDPGARVGAEPQRARGLRGRARAPGAGGRRAVLRRAAPRAGARDRRSSSRRHARRRRGRGRSQLDEHVVAALNGDQITRDPDAPLAAGDTVAFLSADAGG